MRRAVRMESRRSIHGSALLCACCVAVAGCASGTWLESPSEAELPLDPPAHRYPTAIRASLSDEPDSGTAAPSTEALTAATSADPAHATTAAAPTAPPTNGTVPASHRLERHQPFVPPLAVIP